MAKEKEPSCVCGHVRERHWKNKPHRCTADRGRGKCACDQYIPKMTKDRQKSLVRQIMQ